MARLGMALPAVVAAILMVAFCQTSSVAAKDEQEEKRLFYFTTFMAEPFLDTDLKPGGSTSKFGDIYTFRGDLQQKCDSGMHEVGEIAGTIVDTDQQKTNDTWEHMQISTVSFTGPDAPAGVLSILGSGRCLKKGTYSIVGGTGDFVFAEGIMVMQYELTNESTSEAPLLRQLTFYVNLPVEDLSAFSMLKPKSIDFSTHAKKLQELV